MEIRQIRYFTRVVELGSMGKAARDLGVVTSALSQQISRLESELSTRLLQRSATGVVPTEAGLAFFQQAQLALRHLDEAARAAQQARLSGHVSVGMAPTTASVLALPLLKTMRERYPEVRFHLVETLSGHLTRMLAARQLDLAIIFNTPPGYHGGVMPLLDEHLFLVAARGFADFPVGESIRLTDITTVPLVMPTNMHGLSALLSAATGQQDLHLSVVLEVDSLAVLMDTVSAGLAATIQPGAAVARFPVDTFQMIQIADPGLVRRNQLVSLSDNDLSPAALATRVVLRQVAHDLVRQGHWQGATLHVS